MPLDLTPKSGTPTPIPEDERIVRPARTAEGARAKAVTVEDILNPRWWAGHTYLFYNPVFDGMENHVWAIEFAVQPDLSVLLWLLISETYDNQACTQFVRHDLHGTFRMHPTPQPWIEFDVAGEAMLRDDCQPSLDWTRPVSATWSWFVVLRDPNGNRLELSNANYRQYGFADCIFNRTR